MSIFEVFGGVGVDWVAGIAGVTVAASAEIVGESEDMMGRE
jgi:hypothetical protein